MMRVFFVACCVFAFGGAAIGSPIKDEQALVGANKCTWGPSYWCSNIPSAKSCRAVTHCIQTVWEKQTVAEDHDSICTICLDMVKQARDQLQSNETQEDLKQVFEGSCRLIPLKPIRKECVHLADDFIPELIEALSSQMNPQVVCSVAGLCNNAAIDRMLESAADAVPSKEETAVIIDTSDDKVLSCDKCNALATVFESKFKTISRDDVLENMLQKCRDFGSFSDACANIAITYFNDIYGYLKEMTSNNAVCHMSGVCSNKFHQHPETVEIRPLSGVGVVEVKDDIPCELCEQLVRHLRDVLVANTTELEFKNVLIGLCSQTKSFKKECLSIVDQYYDKIYDVLTENLDPNGACFMMGVCPKSDRRSLTKGPIMPLLPVATVQKAKQESKQRFVLGADEPVLSLAEIQAAQLPIDRIMGPPSHSQLLENGQSCTMCQYITHFIQETMASPKTEDEIKRDVMKVCELLPQKVRGQCDGFVEMYGDAVIALAIQELDPAKICSMLNLCPKMKEDAEVFAPRPIEVTVIHKNTGSDNPTCPLCLLAVTEAQQKIRTNKSKEQIKHVLDSICIELPQKLKGECTDFIETYSSELIDMLIGDFTAQEICVYIKLCSASSTTTTTTSVPLLEMNDDNENDMSEEDDLTLTNEIPDDTVNGQIVPEMTPSPFMSSGDCILCREIIKEVEKRVSDHKTEEEIKRALKHACAKMGKYKTKCETYVDDNSDKLIELIMQDLPPKQICHKLGYCGIPQMFEEDLDTDEALIVAAVAPPPQKVSEPLECAICQLVIKQADRLIDDPKNVDEVKAALHKVCPFIPGVKVTKCNKFVEDHMDTIVKFFSTSPPNMVCSLMMVCDSMYQQSKKDIIECAVCRGAVTTLEDLLADKDFDKDLEKAAEQICNELPGKYKAKCVEMVEAYGQSMINLLTNGVEPEKVCEQVGLCFPSNGSFVQVQSVKSPAPKLDVSKRLIGSSECTWGPSHWCSTQANAEKCGAVAHCKDTYWKDGAAPE